MAREIRARADFFKAGGIEYKFGIHLLSQTQSTTEYGLALNINKNPEETDEDTRQFIPVDSQFTKTTTYPKTNYAEGGTVITVDQKAVINKIQKTIMGSANPHLPITFVGSSKEGVNTVAIFYTTKNNLPRCIIIGDPNSHGETNAVDQIRESNLNTDLRKAGFTKINSRNLDTGKGPGEFNPYKTLNETNTGSRPNQINKAKTKDRHPFQHIKTIAN